MLKKIGFSAAVFLCAMNVVSAQVSIERKFFEGNQFRVRNEEKQKQTLVLNGINLESASTSFTTLSTSVGQRGPDGKLVIVTKVESLQSDLLLPGGLPLQFDSGNPDKKSENPLLEPILEILRAMVRLPVTSVVDVKNQLEDVKLPEGEFDKLPEGAKDQLNSEWLKKKFEQTSALFPAAPVKKGDTWEVSSEYNAGQGSKLTFRTKLEYLGTTDQGGQTLDKIACTVLDVSYAIDGNATTQLKSSELKVVNSSGTYLFNRELGDFVEKESRVEVSGPLTLFINGMEFAGKVDLTMESRSKREK